MPHSDCGGLDADSKMAHGDAQDYLPKAHEGCDNQRTKDIREQMFEDNPGAAGSSNILPPL